MTPRRVGLITPLFIFDAGAFGHPGREGCLRGCKEFNIFLKTPYLYDYRNGVNSFKQREKESGGWGEHIVISRANEHA